jgi:glycosyltransferase domain-containing protein
MMRDLTLIISTQNQAARFSALLSYLEEKEADCHILLLDSSNSEAMAANRARVAGSKLNIEFAEFADATPDEKRRQGIKKVVTPFCALCSDDDVVLVDGMRECLQILRSNSSVSLAQGYSFSFMPLPDGDMELHDTRSLAAIDEDSPLRRLAQLLGKYGGPRPGAYRTSALQRISDNFQLLENEILRDLLWSGLTVLEGRIAHLATFSYGHWKGRPARSLASQPLEWFCADPVGLFSAYLHYRELLLAPLIDHPDADQSPQEVRDLLDIIHLRYLIKHAPDAVLEFGTEQYIAGTELAEYWSTRDIHLPDRRAGSPTTAPPAESLGAVKLPGHERSYILLPSFYAPAEIDPLRLDTITGAIRILDAYRPPKDWDPD